MGETTRMAMPSDAASPVGFTGQPKFRLGRTQDGATGRRVLIDARADFAIVGDEGIEPELVQLILESREYARRGGVTYTIDEAAAQLGL